MTLYVLNPQNGRNLKESAHKLWTLGNNPEVYANLDDSGKASARGCVTCVPSNPDGRDGGGEGCKGLNGKWLP